MKLTSEFHGDDIRKIDAKFQGVAGVSVAKTTRVQREIIYADSGYYAIKPLLPGEKVVVRVKVRTEE